MAKVRLSPFVSVVAAGPQVYIRSDLKAFALSGEGVGEFVRRALPLLDGAHDVDAVAAALGDYARDSVDALLQHLQRLGVIEIADEFPSSRDRVTEARLSAFFRYWKDDPRPSTASLASANVGFVGVDEWSVVACEDLVRAGVGALTIFDPVTEGRDRQARTRAVNQVIERLTALAVKTRVSREALDVRRGQLDALRGDITLLVVTVGADELFLLDAIAKMAHRQRLRSLVAHIDGLNGVLGPLVIPGETACWECVRRRSLANHPNPDDAAALQAALLGGPASPRQPLVLPGAGAMLGGMLALETIRIVSNYAQSPVAGRQLTINLSTYETRWHGLVRFPSCPVCGGPSGGRRQSDDEQPAALFGQSEPSAVRDALGGWLDERTGVVRRLVLNHPSPREPQSLAAATALISAHAVPGHCAHEPLIGSGKGMTRAAAMIGAVGEAIERYSASIYSEHELTRASFRKLGPGALDPSSLCLYRAEQYEQAGFSFDRFDPEREISWAEGVWLDSGKTVRVPALPAYFNYRAPRGELFCQVTSNGLAAGSTIEDATLRATLELIERDAFMMTWLQQRPPRRLALNGELGTDVLDVLTELRELGMNADLYLLDSDVAIPSVMCVAWGDGTARAAATVALACHVDPIQAARKAILEQAHIGPYITRLMADGSTKVPRATTDVRSLIDHALFYVPKTRMNAFRFVRSGNRRPIALGTLKRRSSSPAGVDACVAALADAGLRVAIVDVTAPDVRLGPFRVVRAIGPHIQPIDFGYANRRLANPRLLRRGRRINANPHPLA